MKFRTTAIAMAVAGTVAAPVAVQAGADGLYASARVGIWNLDQDDVNDLTFAALIHASARKAKLIWAMAWLVSVATSGTSTKMTSAFVTVTLA